MTRDESIDRIIRTSIVANLGAEDTLFNYGAQNIQDAPDPFILSRSDPINRVRQNIVPLIEQFIQYGRLQTKEPSTVNKVKLITVRGIIYEQKRSINMELETAKLHIKRRQQTCKIASNHAVLLELDICAAQRYLTTHTSDVLSRCLPQLEFHYNKYTSSITAVNVEIAASLLIIDTIETFMSDIVDVWDNNIKDVGFILDPSILDQERKKWIN